jgi:hypothetical protein
MLFKSTLAAAAVLAMTACASHMGSPAMMYSQASLPDAVKVPAGHKVAMGNRGRRPDHLRMQGQGQHGRPVSSGCSAAPTPS